MPTYNHICTNKECNHEWEDEYSIKDDPPKICPKCQQETAKRMISGLGCVKVELYGQELLSKLKADGQKIKKEAMHNEKVLADIVGPSYERNVKDFGG